MAKESMKAREVKRARLVKKYEAKRARLKVIMWRLAACRVIQIPYAFITVVR